MLEEQSREGEMPKKDELVAYDLHWEASDPGCCNLDLLACVLRDIDTKREWMRDWSQESGVEGMRDRSIRLFTHCVMTCAIGYVL